MRKNIIEGLAEYFKSEHWLTFLNFHLQNPDTEIWHAHIYVETMIHPESLLPIMEGFFENYNHPLVRKIDFLSPAPGVGALHNVHPGSLPHFDLFFRFNPDAILAPMEKSKGEFGQNALSWGKKDMDEFYKQFQFKAIGPSEEAEIRKYFRSRHWKQAVGLIMHPDVIHVHCNLRISFDPKILELIARDTLAQQGWTIDKVVPNVFNVRGRYRGKLVFLGTYPERVYDLGWKYDHEVVIAPSYEPWYRDDCQPGFDLCFTSEFDRVVAADPYVKLTQEEVNAVVRSSR